MSVIKRLGNLAKGTLKTWSDDDEPRVLTDPERAAAEDELRRLEAEARHLSGQPAAPPVASAAAKAPASPLEARRLAITKAYAAGVLSVEERDEKLAAVQDEQDALDRGLPPTPRKRTL